MESAVFSPDGAHLLTASDDLTARLWDAHTYVQLEVLAGHTGIIRHAAYSPDGSRAITASDDLTVRIWDAAVAGGLDAQILWQQAAQIDPIPDVKRAQLGLAADPRRRVWRDSATACDQAAAAYYDPDRTAPGIAQALIVADVAGAACAQELAAAPNSARLAYQTGRALLAKRDFNGAKSHFERALSEGYRSAGVDLGNLLLEPAAGAPDPARAAALYMQAWDAGVRIAAFELGQLYEHGTPGAQAWAWYQKGADAGEPTSLARLAVRAEAEAAHESTAGERDGLLLQSFRCYAAAAEAAGDEAWPDTSWANWRYHRATLARMLGQAGMMQSVADAYQKVRAAATVPQGTWLHKLSAHFAGQ